MSGLAATRHPARGIIVDDDELDLDEDNKIKLKSVSDEYIHSLPLIVADANGNEYVDLGLPSGTLWARCNLGATEELGEGLYFQWGETRGYTHDQIGSGEGQKKISYNETIFGPVDYPTKYGPVDNRSSLELGDDAARTIMGGDWMMPTADQLNELAQLPVEVQQQGDLPYIIIKGNNGNKLLLPFFGSYGYEGLWERYKVIILTRDLVKGNYYQVVSSRNFPGSLNVNSVSREYMGTIRGVLNV